MCEVGVSPAIEIAVICPLLVLAVFTKATLSTGQDRPGVV
jgi:hypothetical protein